MSKFNVLLLCGGGSDEHDISLISAGYIQSRLETQPEISLKKLELDAKGQYSDTEGNVFQITHEGYLQHQTQNELNWNIDFVIPCFHGFPGETGDIQSFLTLLNLPYLGASAETSVCCFNKVTAKQWFTSLGIPNTPYLFLSEYTQATIETTEKAFDEWGSVFIKASSQGSSVGCYKVENKNDIENTLAQAFQYSPYVLVEKTILARELEVAVYEHNGEVVASLPGEIICDKNTFYDFDEKYSENSKARTDIEAKKLSKEITDKIRLLAIKAFVGMKLKHLARIDFFLTDKNDILLNEINTFPGMTPISMFPKMLENNGDNFAEFLLNTIKKETR
ncbi:D-alanine--D-alanine ligase [Parashewanella spongiae]|uniref:D-alanine--D-alanine ligase n=1 Tax=Parashewanella spongiae TaxID=342950 RepID=A0A3A6U056_9GAMM|nr:D-alanine--D-alanine ligase [Parashewanella spongiae]MCL1079973.1 D-alanine--D-alanine ligase [Parashewanella spongiae]RJY05994.1 D-alanine--D-alanine ligase [Parashewanella spongiae]